MTRPVILSTSEESRPGMKQMLRFASLSMTRSVILNEVKNLAWVLSRGLA